MDTKYLSVLPDGLDGLSQTRRTLSINPEQMKWEGIKVHKKNMSCECALNFDQWKTFAENYKPMRVWLWFVYKFT